MGGGGRGGRGRVFVFVRVCFVVAVFFWSGVTFSCQVHSSIMIQRFPCQVYLLVC